MAALIKSPRFGGESVDLPAMSSASASSVVPTTREMRLSLDAEKVEAVASVRQPARQAMTVDAPHTPSERSGLSEGEMARIVEQAREAAEKEGYKKGLEAGRHAGKQEYAKAVDAWIQMLSTGRAEMAALIEESEKNLASVVFEAVCKIVGKELVSASACAAVVNEVLTRVMREEVVSVRISPRDHAAILEHGRDLAGLHGMSFDADTRVELGGCILELKAGNIDGRIETQFRLFAQSLKNAAYG